MCIRKESDEGSHTAAWRKLHIYSSSLKPSQGGPHLQSNLTTKAKYSTTSNQIREMPTALCGLLRQETKKRYFR